MLWCCFRFCFLRLFICFHFSRLVICFPFSCLFIFVMFSVFVAFLLFPVFCISKHFLGRVILQILRVFYNSPLSASLYGGFSLFVLQGSLFLSKKLKQILRRSCNTPFHLFLLFSILLILPFPMTRMTTMTTCSMFLP